MAQSVFNLALGSVFWPLLTNWAEPQILVTTGEQPLLPSKEAGKLRPVYMHNVLPSAAGLHSVGYTEVIPADPVATDFTEAFILRDSGENRVVFSSSAGKNYLYLEGLGAWRSTNPITTSATTKVSVTYIHQRTFICYSYLGVYEYEAATDSLVLKTLTGVESSAIKGISSCNNFLLLYTDDMLYMSSMTDLLDFTPSLASGAGSVSVQDLRGNIEAVLPAGGSIVVYTTYNAVGGQYSGNLRFPFVFKEIKGAGGIASAEHVTWGTSGDTHYAWTTFGLQILNITTSQLIFPEVSDFLTAQILEDVDDTTGVLTRTQLSSQVEVKLSWIAGRWLVISYGATALTNALVLDTSLQRWGKLKIAHVDCFNYEQPNEFTPLDMAAWSHDFAYYTQSYSALTVQTPVAVLPKQSFAFIQATGRIVVVNFDITGTASDNAVLWLGSFRTVRSRRTVLHGYTLVGVLPTTTNLATKVLTSENPGQFTGSTPAYLKRTSASYAEYQCAAQGNLLSVSISGTFDLSSVELTVSVAGRL